MTKEELKNKRFIDATPTTAFSKTIKAGKRIYYLDVKKNQKNEMFITITESKKILSGDGKDSQVSFEKHKIFLYKEDLNNFLQGLHEAVNYIERTQGLPLPIQEANRADTSEQIIPESPEIKIDIDF